MKMIDCPECLGNGEIENTDINEWETCPTCDGAGVIEWKDPNEGRKACDV